jgi:hypothetical protein
MKINKKIVMPGMRRKVTFIKLKFFRIERRRNRPHVIYIKLNWNTDIWLFFLPNATCLLEKQKYQCLQSLVWHIISYWKMILCLFLVAKARIPSVILSSWSAVLSGQIDVPYVYKPLAMMNFRECFKMNF